MKTSLTLVLGFLAALTLTACSKKNSDYDSTNEAAQQIGDVSASIDESGGSSGTLSMNEPGGLDEDKILRQTRPLFSRYGVAIDQSRFNLIPDAHATSCLLAPGFSSCSSNVITRTFGGCTILGAQFDGTVALTWGGGASSCHMSAAGHTITRVPAFTITSSMYNASFSVTKTGSVGQRITWASGSAPSATLNFTNDGIRRILAVNGSNVLDFTTSTTSAITITGTNRAGRVVNGGALQVVNNLTGVSCSYVPSSVTWTSSCICPTSGSWTGTCTDGKVTTLTHTGCGTATFTLGSDSQSINFDRCY